MTVKKKEVKVEENEILICYYILIIYKIIWGFLTAKEFGAYELPFLGFYLHMRRFG